MHDEGFSWWRRAAAPDCSPRGLGGVGDRPQSASARLALGHRIAAITDSEQCPPSFPGGRISARLTSRAGSQRSCAGDPLSIAIGPVRLTFGGIFPGCRAAASAANSARLTVAGRRAPTGPFLGWGARVPSDGVERARIRRRGRKTLISSFIYGVLPTLLPLCCPVSCRSPTRPGLHPRRASSLLPVTSPARPPPTACVKSLAGHQPGQASTHGVRQVSCRSPARPGLHPWRASSFLPITSRGTLPARSLSALLADPRAVEALYQGASALGAGPPTPPAPPGAFRCPAFVPARVARPRASSPRRRGPRGHARYSR